VKNVINLLQQKVAQNVTISLGYFIFSKNHNESPKIAQSGHPDNVGRTFPTKQTMTSLFQGNGINSSDVISVQFLQSPSSNKLKTCLA
jgi:hypothetical protein